MNLSVRGGRHRQNGGRLEIGTVGAITSERWADVTDESLMARLFVNAGVRAGARFHAEPDWSALVPELKRPCVNLLVLWEEYRANHPQGYAYSRYVAAKIMLRGGYSDRRRGGLDLLDAT